MDLPNRYPPAVLRRHVPCDVPPVDEAACKRHFDGAVVGAANTKHAASGWLTSEAMKLRSCLAAARQTQHQARRRRSAATWLCLSSSGVRVAEAVTPGYNTTLAAYMEAGSSQT